MGGVERDYLLTPGKGRPLHAIAIEVCTKHRATIDELRKPSRKRIYVRARHEAFYLAYLHTEASLPAIGAFFERDHTTVIYGIDCYARAHNLPNPLRG